jgi:diadenosine tetraphosphatase ApaH/serine/threonine PP2A family protein phosphatase
MLAVLSDIHGNLEALRAVLEDARRNGVEAVYCLGDLVGYGPNPRECVDLAMRWCVVLLGNFDQAARSDPAALSPTAVAATRSLVWSRAQLDAPVPYAQAARDRLAFLANRPESHREGDSLFVHGSPRNPLHEYVYPEDIHNQRKMDRIFRLVGRYCFQGHTHVPGIFTEGAPEDLYQFHAPDEIDFVYRLDGRKTLCNVGSVGQPRDGDWRACYVLLDGDAIRYRRVEYDIDTTVTKIHAVPDLDNLLGHRLREGR